MSTRFTWLLGILLLISFAFLVACGSHYSASSDGLLIVPSQGSAVLQAFSFNLSSGHASQINTSPKIPGPPDQGSTAAIILDPAGTFAYMTTINTPNLTDPCTTKDAIATYKVNSDGTIATIGSQVLNPTSIVINNQATPVPVVPVTLALDSAGKFLFVADRITCVPGNPQIIVPGTISVFSVGSNASLTEVSGSPFAVPVQPGSTTPNPLSLAVTPTVFPSENARCSGTSAPTSEYLYVADAANDQVWDFSVASSGALGAPSGDTSVPGFATGQVPSGVAVDPCNRFVYVANQNSNDINAYTICNAVSLPTCPNADGSLVQVGARISAANGPGPLAVDPLGNFLYVVDTQSNAISNYRISQVTGSLSPLSPATVGTGTSPVSIAIRADDSWLFVTNNGSASGTGSVSQFAITPATGTLTPAGSGITTDTFPSGVAVK